MSAETDKLIQECAQHIRFQAESSLSIDANAGGYVEGIALDALAPLRSHLEALEHELAKARRSS